MKENEYQKLERELFRRALYDLGFRFSSFIYDASPDSLGRVMDRFKELCKERGLDPVTMESIQMKDGDA